MRAPSDLKIVAASPAVSARGSTRPSESCPSAFAGVTFRKRRPKLTTIPPPNVYGIVAYRSCHTLNARPCRMTSVRNSISLIGFAAKHVSGCALAADEHLPAAARGEGATDIERKERREGKERV